MTTILCIDPGKKYAGWAVFQGRALVLAGVEVGDLSADPSLKVAWDVWSAACNPHRVGVFIGELPAHRGLHERASYNSNVLPLVSMVNTIKGVCCQRDAIVKLPTPIEWKGNTSGDAFLGSIRRRLTRDERQVLIDAGESGRFRPSMLEHALDAAGLGLWYLGRRG